jgi:hypothetical protein
MSKRKGMVTPKPDPRYDEVFWEGTTWLDDLIEDDTEAVMAEVERDKLRAEMDRLDKWVIATSGGASMLALNPVDAAIEIAEGRAKQIERLQEELDIQVMLKEALKPFADIWECFIKNRPDSTTTSNSTFSANVLYFQQAFELMKIVNNT